MKPLPQTLRSATIVAAVALAACQGPPPTSGTWVGKNISFNVSADGAKLTSEASTLENGASLVVGIALESNRFGMSRQTLDLYVDIPIIDGFFNFSDGELEVEGQLHSPTEASGVFRLVDEVQQPGQYGMTTGTVRGTGEWSASPSPTLAQPPERDSTREVKVHFDGLYQAASSQSGVFRYLRFYADGTVVSVSSTGSLYGSRPGDRILIHLSRGDG